MKKNILPSILIALLLSSCSGMLTPSPTNTPVPTSTTSPSLTSTYTPAISQTPTTSIVDMSKPVEFIPQKYFNEINLNPNSISPSGEKIILDSNYSNGMPYKEQDVFTLQILNTRNDTQVENIEIQLDIPFTFYYVTDWAPDEKSFAAIFYDHNYFNGSETCCGEAIAITSLDGEKAETHIYHWGWNHSSQLTWSEDSSMLSVSFSGDHTPLIFIKSGELIETFPQTTNPLFWSGNDLYITEQKGKKLQLRLYDFDSQRSNLIFDDVKGTRYVSYNSIRNQILLTEYTPTQGSRFTKPNRFHIIDMNTVTTREISLPQSNEMLSYHWSTSPSQDFVAFQGIGGSLWMFNWNTYSFEYYGQIKDLFGWYENTDGFLVTSLDGQQKIIKPSE